MYKDAFGVKHKTYEDYVANASGDVSYEVYKAGKWNSVGELESEWLLKRLYKDEEGNYGQ